MNNSVITNIRTVPVNRLSMKDEVITYNDLSAKLNDIDNRLSDIQIDSDSVHEKEVANIVAAIVQRFGGDAR